MRLKNRFLLVGLGVILFFVATPALILFASGFKFDPATYKLIKTGSLVVKSEPDAAVYIDGKLEKSTPAVIRFLLPKDYTITVAKGNFQSWTKRLTIHPQLVTWANSNRDFITLFFENPLLIKTDSIIPLIPIVDTGEYYLSEKKVMRNNPSNRQEIVVHENADGIGWDKTSNRLLIWNANEVLLFDPAGSASPDLILRSISPVSNPKLNWHTGYVYYQNEGKIKAVELDGRDHRNIYTIADAMENFLIDEKGKILQIFDQKEVREYQVR